MSTKRQPSKQRRQTQNQKQRQALIARREAAAAAASKPTPSGKVGGTSGSRAGQGSSGSGSVISRLRGATSTGRAARTTSAGGASTGLPIGHRAAMSALFAAVAAAVVGSLLIKMPVDRSGEAISTREQLVAEWAHTALDEVQANPEASDEQIAAGIDDWLPGGKEPYIKAYWPLSATVVLPVLGCGLGFRAVSRRSSAKLVNRTMYLTLFGSLLSSQLLLIFLPAVISMAVAAFQVRKAEVAAAQLAGDGVIDVAEVDDLDAQDDDDLDDDGRDDLDDLDEEGIDDAIGIDDDEVIEVDEVDGDVDDLAADDDDLDDADDADDADEARRES